MATWIEDNIYDLVGKYAEEDSCSVEEWERRAVLFVVRERYWLDNAIQEAKALLPEACWYQDCVLPFDHSGIHAFYG